MVIKKMKNDTEKLKNEFKIPFKISSSPDKKTIYNQPQLHSKGYQCHFKKFASLALN